MGLLRYAGLTALCLASVASAQAIERVRLQPAPDRIREVLRSVNLENPVLGEPVTLTVRNPYLNEGTHLSFEYFKLVQPAKNSAESERAAKSSTVIVKWNADPAKRYVVDCEMRFVPPNPEPIMVFKDVRSDEKMIDVTSNRAAFVTTPGLLGHLWVSGNGPFDFKGCTITPVG